MEQLLYTKKQVTLTSFLLMCWEENVIDINFLVISEVCDESSNDIILDETIGE